MASITRPAQAPGVASHGAPSAITLSGSPSTDKELTLARSACPRSPGIGALIIEARGYESPIVHGAHSADGSPDVGDVSYSAVHDAADLARTGDVPDGAGPPHVTHITDTTQPLGEGALDDDAVDPADPFDLAATLGDDPLIDDLVVADNAGVVDASSRPPGMFATRLLRLPIVVIYVVAWAVVSLVRAIVCFVGIVASVAKYPVIIVFAAYVSLLLIPLADTAPRPADVISTSLCAIPGFPICPSTPPGNSDAVANAASATSTVRTPSLKSVDFPALMAVQSRTLSTLLTHSVAGSELALGIKHAELAVKDLVYIIRTSNLAGKLVLARALEEFAQQAKVTGRRLQQLCSKLDGAVDTVLVFDQYAIRTLDEARQSGAVAGHVAMTQLFQSALDVLAFEVAGVQDDAALVIAALDALEDELSVIQSLSEHEFLSTGVAAGRDAPSFWTMFNGGTSERQQLAHQLGVLENIDSYRRRSVAYVAATAQTLVVVEADVSQLHKKLLATHSTIGELPIEVHIASIERSVRRLHDEAMKRRGQYQGIDNGSAADGSAKEH